MKVFKECNGMPKYLRPKTKTISAADKAFWMRGEMSNA